MAHSWANLNFVYRAFLLREAHRPFKDGNIKFELTPMNSVIIIFYTGTNSTRSLFIDDHSHSN